MARDEWSELTDEKGLSAARRKSEFQYRDLGSGEIARLREVCKQNLFMLGYGVLGYDLMSADLHGHLSRWLEETRSSQFRSILLPRGHYKSSLVTIIESIQIALPTFDGGPTEHPWNLGPNAKLLIAHETRESASRFLFEITAAFVRNELFMALFPELIPSPRTHRMNKWELELPRSAGHQKEPTFDTLGAGGAAQGRHYNHIKLDDIIGEDARESPTVMKRTIDWFDNIGSLLTRMKFEGFDLIGTRWSAKDVYEHAVETYGVDHGRSFNTTTMRLKKMANGRDGLLSVYFRPVIENGNPIFPEEFSLEILNVLRKNPKIWAAQYANDPKESGLTTFSPAWLKFYNVIPGANTMVVFDGDSSRRVELFDLDRVVLVDPSVGEDALSDETGIIVSGTDDKMNVYILETIKARLTPPELIETLINLHLKYYPRVMSIEEVVFSATYKYWLSEKTRERGINLPIIPFKPGSKRSKEARIDGLGNFFAAGQVYITEGMHDLRDEYENYPMLSGSDHLLDALAQGPSVWGPGMDTSRIDSYRKVEQTLLHERSSITGY